MTSPHIGYTLSSEEHGPATLVANARAAEAAGFEDLAAMVRPEDMAYKLAHGPAIAELVEEVETALSAGVTHVHIHQIGPDQAPFIQVAREELLPRLRGQ